MFMFNNHKSYFDPCFFVGGLHEFRDTSVLVAHNISETEESTLKSTPETTVPVNRDRVDSTDGQSNTDDSNALIPHTPSQPILLEDPLVINSPHILIPKKDKSVFKRNHWPQQKKFPVVSTGRSRKATKTFRSCFFVFITCLHSN